MNKSMNRVARFVHNTAMVLRRPPLSIEEMVTHAFGSRSLSVGGAGCSSSASVANASVYGGSTSSPTTFNKSWVHPPDALIYGRVEYTVKFLGEVAVSQSKGTEVIKEAIQKLQFNLQLRRAQGYKLPKVELHISVEHVRIIDTRTKQQLFQYPLHRISFCADDKHDKRVFAFIAKRAADSSEHNCFVFLCDKQAENITLTVGEAFDLAYRRFIESNGKELELRKQLIVLRKRINELETENSALKEHLATQQRQVSQQKVQSSTPVNYDLLNPNQVKTLNHTKTLNLTNSAPATKNWESFDDYDQSTFLSPSIPMSPIPPTPVLFGNESATSKAVLLQPAISPKGSGEASPSTSAVAATSSATPTVIFNGNNNSTSFLNVNDDLYDPFFNPREGEHEFDRQIRSIERHLTDLRDGFKHGLTFANDDFHVDVNDIDADATSTVQASAESSG